VQLNYRNTVEISSAMLAQITDLSKVQFVVVDGLADASGALKTKYHSQRYYDRITYTGHEMNAIIPRLEGIQSRVDMSLPEIQRARQLYELVAAEFPVMRDYNQLTDGARVSQSLRGVTSYNSVGREGLICAGFSSVYKELGDRVGLRVEYIRGDAFTDPLRNGRGGKHAWNVVVTDQGIVPVDVTWRASSGNDWFGPSDLFAAQHVSDAVGESFHVFNQPLREVMQQQPINMAMVADGNINTQIRNILSVHEQSYPGQGINALRRIVETNNYNSITRNGNARAMMEGVSIQDIGRYVEINDSIQHVIANQDAKFGFGSGIRAINSVAETGNYNLITRTNGAREALQQLTVNELRMFMNG
jgi:hypothetical protein